MTPRGFPDAEFAARLRRAQTAMEAARIDALLLTTEADIRYVTGFLTRFFESPTRPWFVVVPGASPPIAVIPSIGAPLMAQTWVTDIRTWRSPDYTDDGVQCLADTLRAQVPVGGRIGVPSGPETHLRMPLDSWAALQDRMPGYAFGSDAGVMRDLRLIKSDREIEKIRRACAIADAAFARVPEILAPGRTLAEVFRGFQALCLEEGADWVAYLAGAAGQGGYGDIIAPATDAPILAGDVVMLDTGAVHDGYFCDFDRNWSVGPADRATADAYARLLEASHVAFDAARPGARAADLFAAMDAVLTGGRGGAEAGRYGHGLGLQLTEGVSLVPDDQTRLAPGMVLTLEPSLTVAPGRGLVHEEDIVITQTGAAYLTTPAPAALQEV